MCLLDHGGDVSAGGECRNERSHSDWLRQRQGKKRNVQFSEFLLVCTSGLWRKKWEEGGRRKREEEEGSRKAVVSCTRRQLLG